MQGLIKYIKKTGIAILLLVGSLNAHATFMDTDTYCVNYGCVLICDTGACNIYDEWNFSTSTVLAAGQQLIFYTTNPVVGAGTTPLNTNYLNTVTKVTTPAANQGTRLTINSQTSGGIVTDAGAAGWFDASDTISAFGIDATTDITWVATPATGVTAGGTNPQRHSFFFCSRNVNVDIRAVVGANTSTLDIPATTPPASVGYGFTWTRTGTDAGTAYGARTLAGTTFVASAVANLGTLAANTTVGSFTTSTYGTANAATTPAAQLTQCVRVQPSYTMPAADLSMGRGDLNIRVDYTFWKR